MDGFFTKPKPSSSLGRHPQSGSRRSAYRAGTSMTGQSRHINDFDRAEGFHAPVRRSLQPGLGVQPHGTKRPLQPLLMDLPSPADTKRRQRHPKPKQSRFRTIRKWTLRTAAVCLILVLGTGGLLFGKGYLQLNKVFQGGSSAAALNSNVDPTLLKGEGDGRVNILLIGVGGQNHSGGDLTDTLIIASVDPINNQAVLFSVPRDLWTKMPNNYFSNYQKINAAYSSGKYKYSGRQDQSNKDTKAVQAGFQAVDGVVERVMGVPIHYNALVNFQAFRQAVDTVGGVTVNVPEQLYDPTMAWENGYNPVLAKAGVQTFDGKKALNYVRSRETSSDFARSQRQRAVMMALKDEVTNAGTLANPMKLSNLLGAFGDNVQSDISLSDMTRLSSIMKKIPNSQIQSIGLADPPNNFLTTGNINGLSVVMPRAGLEDYSKIQAFVRSKLKDGYISQENANVTVLNGTVVPGLATEKAEELKSYGYNVGTVDNAPAPDFNKTTIVDLSGGAKKYTLNYLKNRYRVQNVVKQLPAGIVQGSANIVIILGQDATATTQN